MHKTLKMGMRSTNSALLSTPIFAIFAKGFLASKREALHEGGWDGREEPPPAQQGDGTRAAGDILGGRGICRASVDDLLVSLLPTDLSI